MQLKVHLIKNAMSTRMGFEPMPLPIFSLFPLPGTLMPRGQGDIPPLYGRNPLCLSDPFFDFPWQVQPSFFKFTFFSFLLLSARAAFVGSSRSSPFLDAISSLFFPLGGLYGPPSKAPGCFVYPLVSTCTFAGSPLRLLINVSSTSEKLPSPSPSPCSYFACFDLASAFT
jgi:hypothetical protein